MKQLKIFSLPAEEAAANDFLSKNPPELVTPFADKIVIYYDDASYPQAYKAEEIRALMGANVKEIMTHAISMWVTEIDLDFARSLLVQAEAIVVPSDPKTKKPDTAITNDKAMKIQEHTNAIAGLVNGIANLSEMIRRFNTRNIAMQKMLDKVMAGDGTINAADIIKDPESNTVVGSGDQQSA